MRAKNNKANLIILIIVGLLFLLLIIISVLIQALEEANSNQNLGNVIVSTDTTKRTKTVKEVIEGYGSKYLKREKKVFVKIYANFKYDLYDENEKSKKTYFYEMIEEIVKIEKDSFYLIDNEKNIEIYVGYDNTKETYKIIINGEEDYYDKTDEEIYLNSSKVKIAARSDFALQNSLLLRLTSNNMYYAKTDLASEDRVELENGYYSYNDGAMFARLQKGRVLNILFTGDYKEKIAVDTYSTTPLEDIYNRFSNLAFGSVKDGYLGYRTEYAYIFLYEDEVSVYGYQYKENEYFDTYLKDYCDTKDLEKLYTDFTTEWTNYFEKEYNPETQSLRITFPTRGIEIDIEGNDTKGIKIYNNYYLTDIVKELIKENKITLEVDKDLIHITEQARRENSR